MRQLSRAITLMTAITLVMTCALTRPGLAAPVDPARLDRVVRQWTGIRAAARPWQRTAGGTDGRTAIGIRPRLSAPELAQLRRIARMPRISVRGDQITGANDAYYRSARIGRPLPGSRMVALELDADGVPHSRTVHGGVSLLRRPWGDGRITEELQLRATRERAVTAPRLIEAGVYPGAQVRIRRIGRGFSAPAGIAIAPAGRVEPIQVDPDGYTLLPGRTPATGRARLEVTRTR